MLESLGDGFNTHVRLCTLKTKTPCPQGGFDTTSGIQRHFHILNHARLDYKQISL